LRRVRSDKSGDGFEMVRTPAGLSEAKGGEKGWEEELKIAEWRMEDVKIQKERG